jgi:hypothetical protein
MSLVDGLRIWIGSNLLFFGFLVWQRVLEPKIYAYLDDRQRAGRALWQKSKSIKIRTYHKTPAVFLGRLLISKDH